MYSTSPIFIDCHPPLSAAALAEAGGAVWGVDWACATCPDTATRRARVASPALNLLHISHSTESFLSGATGVGVFSVVISINIREYSRLRAYFTAVCLYRQANSLFPICLAQISHYRADLPTCPWRDHTFDIEKILPKIGNFDVECIQYVSGK